MLLRLRRLLSTLVLVVFSVSILSTSLASAAPPSDKKDNPNNEKDHIVQQDKALKKVTEELDPTGNTLEKSNIQENAPRTPSNKYQKPTPASDKHNPGEICQWVDDLGRPRSEWHKDMAGGKPMNLFKQCFGGEEAPREPQSLDSFSQAATGLVIAKSPNNKDSNNENAADKKAGKKNSPKKDLYAPNNPHPGCQGIIAAYENQQNKQPDPIGPGLTKNYQNCLTYGTPYAKSDTTDPSLDDLAGQLAASGSITINNDELFTESDSVMLTLTPSAPNPEKMQFSNDNATWSEWEPFFASKDWLITDNGAGIKTVYVRYKTGNTVSVEEFDKILLLPKYGASYSVSNFQNVLETGRTYPLKLTIKNTGFLTWDSSDEQFPVHVTYRFKDQNNTFFLKKIIMEYYLSL